MHWKSSGVATKPRPARAGRATMRTTITPSAARMAEAYSAPSHRGKAGSGVWAWSRAAEVSARGGWSGGANEAYHHRGQLLTPILLQEVATADDRRVWLPLRARDGVLEDPVGPARDRVTVTERGEKRLLEGRERLPRPAVGLRRRIVGPRGHERRELPRAGLVAIVGKRGVVGGDHLRGERSGAAALHDAADVELGRRLRVLLPGLEGRTERRVARRQERVGRDHARETIRMLGHQP